jgi:signal transduction histidine kinase
VNEYGLKANAKGIDLRCNLSNNNEELIIENDEIKLRQIIVSLTNNAIKFTKTGFVEIGCSENEKNFLFQVKDTGIGIAKENHEKIFDRFFKIESSDTCEYGGNGLGLIISKSFVEILGGKIWV